MIYKDSNYEKVTDLGKGYGELFRIHTWKLSTNYLLREITTASDQEAEQIIESDKQKQKVFHDNLIQLIFQKFSYEKQEKPQKNDNQNQQKSPQELLKDLQNILKKTTLQEQKTEAQKSFKNYWKIMRVMPDIQCTLHTFLDNKLKDQKSLYEQNLEEQMQLDISQIIESQDQGFDVSLELKKHMEKINLKMNQEFPSQLLSEKNHLMLSEFFKNNSSVVKKEHEKYLDLEFLQLFLKQFLNLLGGLEFNKLPIRDICPMNIFVPIIQPNKYDLVLGDMDEYQKFFFPVEKEYSNLKKKVSFTRMGENFIGYMSPEMKSQYLKQRFRENDHLNIYKSGVYSLGLVTLYLATLEDPWGLNMENEPHIEEQIKNQLKKVKQIYGKNLKNIIKLMLQQNQSQRPSFMQLDDNPLFLSFVNSDLQEIEQSFYYKSKEEMQDLLQNNPEKLEKFQKNTQKLRFFKTDLQHQNIQQLFQCPNLYEISFQFFEISLQNIQTIFQNNSSSNFQNLTRIQFSGLDNFYTKELDALLTGISDTGVKHFDFSGSLFDTNCIKTLCEHKKTCHRIVTLNLSSNFDLKDEGLNEFAKNAQLFQNLKYLSLGGSDQGCALSNVSIEIFNELLKIQNILPRLKELDLSYNSLDNEALIMIVDSEQFKRLSKLNLEKTMINTHKYRLTSKQKQIMKNIIL